MANPRALYNEIDLFAADWLVELEARGHIAAGSVDRRSVAELTSVDVDGPGQRHFFAGIGGWSYALRRAGVRDNADVWTGSCPCQPFSGAGRRRGTGDARHLWPAWFRLIDECHPPIIFGEQVASGDGLRWLDAVFADLEGADYACAAADLPAAGVGAPHKRQRLYFVAYARGERREGLGLHLRERRPRPAVSEIGGGSEVDAVALADDARSRWTERTTDDGRGSERRRAPLSERQDWSRSADDRRMDDGAMADDDGTRRKGRPRRDDRAQREPTVRRPGPGFDGLDNRRPWDSVAWLPCSDGKARPAQSVALAVADGLPDGLGLVRDRDHAIVYPLIQGALARVPRLRGYGNAIVTEQAAAFITAALDAIEGNDVTL